MSDKLNVVEEVREHYGAVARGERCGCGGPEGDVALVLGYSKEDVELAKGNLGLGCGNPLAMSGIEPGMTVLDLGSGAGFDAFLAWRRVGPTGRVIGVDMTDDMLAQARKNAAELGATNVEFRKGYIEKLPVEDASVDLVISNCVINLSADKPAVFREIARVLKPGGRFAVSDIVLLADLPADVAASVAAYVGCIAGASHISDYIRHAVEAGLDELSIPQIAVGDKLISAVAPSDTCCGAGLLETAARSVASIKLHGKKV
ncbi:MAG: arsenite methyltransferase [Terriglobales bacterium]